MYTDEDESIEFPAYDIGLYLNETKAFNKLVELNKNIGKEFFPIKSDEEACAEFCVNCDEPFGIKYYTLQKINVIE